MSTPASRILRRFVATFISSLFAQVLVRLEAGSLNFKEIFAVSAVSALIMAADKTFREIWR